MTGAASRQVVETPQETAQERPLVGGSGRTTSPGCTNATDSRRSRVDDEADGFPVGLRH